MIDYREFFKGKKITQIGLGLLGRGVGDADFLAECGADLIVTDMKGAEDLAPSLEKLKQYSNIKFKLGGHDMDDFKDRDFILKAAGVPLDSPYIAEAKKNNIPVEMDASLFCKLSPDGVITIGVTGTRGKSTVTHLIYQILKTAGKNAFLAGNLRDIATLPLLKEVKSGDYVVLELDSWQLQGFGDAGISPHIAIFTTFMDDHMSYYGGDRSVYFADKANIYKHQKKEDVLVVGEDVGQAVMSKKMGEGEVSIAYRSTVPPDWKIKILGEHNLLNISCAIEACKALGIAEEDIKEGVEGFTGVEGRLQFVKEIRGIKIYNDNNSTTPDATIAALKSFDSEKLILICGGSDKALDIENLDIEMQKCKSIILLPGSGSDRFKIKATKVQNLREAMDKALEEAVSGEIILFSPGFASFGLFKNEYDRNDQFLDIVKSLE